MNPLRFKFEPTDVSCAAVKDDFVAALSTGDLFQGLDEVEPKLATLHTLGDSDVFNVPDNAKAAGKLALDKDCADSNKLRCIQH